MKQTSTKLWRTLVEVSHVHQGKLNTGMTVFAVGFPLFASETKSQPKIQGWGIVVNLFVRNSGRILLGLVLCDMRGKIMLELKMATFRKRSVVVTEGGVGWSNSGHPII